MYGNTHQIVTRATQMASCSGMNEYPEPHRADPGHSEKVGESERSAPALIQRRLHVAHLCNPASNVISFLDSRVHILAEYTD